MKKWQEAYRTPLAYVLHYCPHSQSIFVCYMKKGRKKREVTQADKKKEKLKERKEKTNGQEKMNKERMEKG